MVRSCGSGRLKTKKATIGSLFSVIAYLIFMNFTSSIISIISIAPIAMPYEKVSPSSDDVKLSLRF